ncbi:hypothetical protein ACFRFL_14195 [Streptomyces sp. NPDC056708]|uniref:hypothetical protein n=1 Tax=unclassified Streptomyces TaxID=2593676 RepID=UPI0036C4EB00
MACACQKKRQQWEVVADGGSGKVMYSGTKATATAVAKRYPNSVVREKDATEGAAKA